MTRPLTLLLYERLLPGSQLANRLQDLGYRVQSVTVPAEFVETAQREKPMVVLADLESRQTSIPNLIGDLKQNSATAHIPVIAFSGGGDAALQESARAAGARLTVTDTAILAHLSQFLDQALQVD